MAEKREEGGGRADPIPDSPFKRMLESAAPSPQLGQSPPSGSPAPSSPEGGPLPQTWREAVPYVVWVVLILGFGLELINALTHAEWLRVIVCFVGLMMLAAVTLHWHQIKERVSRTHPNLIFVSFALLLQAIILTPFAEESRWPFSARFATVPKKDYDALNVQLEEANNRADALERMRASAEKKIIAIEQELTNIIAKLDAADRKLAQQSATATNRYTRTQIEVRQQAIRDLSAAMGGPTRAAVTAGKKIEGDGVGNILQQDGVAGLSKRLNEVQRQAKSAFSDIDEVLIKYRAYDDVQKIARDWSYLPIIESTQAYIEILKIVPDGTFPGIPPPPVQKAREQWGTAVSGFNNWFEMTMGLIAAKNREYENTPIQ